MRIKNLIFVLLILFILVGNAYSDSNDMFIKDGKLHVNKVVKTYKGVSEGATVQDLKVLISGKESSVIFKTETKKKRLGLLPYPTSELYIKEYLISLEGDTFKQKVSFKKEYIDFDTDFFLYWFLVFVTFAIVFGFVFDNTKHLLETYVLTVFMFVLGTFWYWIFFNITFLGFVPFIAAIFYVIVLYPKCLSEFPEFITKKAFLIVYIFMMVSLSAFAGEYLVAFEPKIFLDCIIIISAGWLLSVGILRLHTRYFF